MRIFKHVYLVGSGTMGFDWTDPADCNVYLLNGGSELALIDAGTGLSLPQIAENINADGLSPQRIRHILLTHLHADHAGGAAGLREMTGAAVAAHHEARDVLETADEAAIDLTQARAHGFYPPDYVFRACPLDRSLQDGETFEVGSLHVRVRLLPGHSRFDTFYFVADGTGHVSLFSGDSLFFDGKISMLNTHDFSLHALARCAEQLSKERVDSLFPGHLQPALCNGSQHVEKAFRIFDSLRVPPSIV